VTIGSKKFIGYQRILRTIIIQEFKYSWGRITYKNAAKYPRKMQITLTLTFRHNYEKPSPEYNRSYQNDNPRHTAEPDAN